MSEDKPAYEALRGLLDDLSHLLTRYEKTQLRAALDELERLRAERARQLRHAFAQGWAARGETVRGVLALIGADDRERAAKDYIAALADSAPQQPEHGGATCAFPGCVHPDHQRATVETKES